MTREEKIINEAKKCYSDNIQCYDAFLHGTKFADEHPKNVWHNANEKPNCGSDVIALDRDNVPVYGTFKDDDYDEYIYRCHGFSYEIFEYEYVTKWAYIDDLLPKKFGNSELLKGGEK